MRRAALLAVCALAAPLAAAPEPGPEYVLAVEFPYYLYPRAQWERELVWLKSIGVQTVEFSIPWNWHQLQPGDFDFIGRTSPRRDLAGLIRILRKLDLRGWVRPLPPVPGWANDGWPAGEKDGEARQAWLQELGRLLATQTERHGGPIAFAGSDLSIDAAAPPQPVTTISAADPDALVRSRAAMMSPHGALLWRDVEETVYPAGWEAGEGSLLRPGAVDLNGAERPSTAPLRRQAAFLCHWAALIGTLRSGPPVKPAEGTLPRGVTAAELVSRRASAVTLINRGSQGYRANFRVVDPITRHALVIPSVSVPAREALWLPLEISLGGGAFCRECTNFSSAERIVYATAELQAVEFENGVLALEFAAPEPGEVILQLARKPVGPFLAAGKPTKFDFDDATLRARLPVPKGSGPGNHVRIGLAIEEPETSAFFTETRRLVIGQENLVSTVYSSPDVASRSRLLAPEGFTAASTKKSPNEIDYTVKVPPDALHGDWASLALEADGVPLGRARVQLFRPASIRLTQAIGLHFGSLARLAVEPPTAAVDARAGGELEVIIRNNTQAIQNYHVEAAGDGLEFLPARTDISIGAVAERPVSFRVFGKEGATGLHEWRLTVSGGTNVQLPMRMVLLPRTGGVAWSADLDGDGWPEWVLESQKIRAVFSAQDSGRWLELTWKDTDTNFVPEQGVFARSGAVEVRAAENGLELVGPGWTRTIRLNGSALTIEQTTALPNELLTPQTQDNVRLSVERQSPNRAVFTLEQVARREP